MTAGLEDGLRYEHGREWSACTLMGPGKPVNADALAIDLDGGCLAFAVADGVGAMAGSQTASGIAANAAVDRIAKRDWLDESSVSSMFTLINRAVGEGLKAKKDAGATTLVLAAVAGGQAIVASMGDSEILSIGRSGPAQSLAPVDHLPVRTNILLAWLDGEASFDAHVIPLEALPHRLCLVTDGVAGSLSYERIAELVRSVPVTEAARLLVHEARAAGSRDDATALVISDLIETEAEPGLLDRLGGIFSRR